MCVLRHSHIQIRQQGRQDRQRMVRRQFAAGAASRWASSYPAEGARLSPWLTLLVDDGDPLGIRKEDANDGRVVFDMRAEIAERIGMATFDDGIGFRRERAHCG